MASGILGLLECYYGPPWSISERHHVLRTAAALGYSHYLIGLKDDAFHRDRWRDPYPPYQLGHHASLVREGQRHGVEVGFALSPGLDIDYGSVSDVERLIAKYRQWQAMGSRVFGLYFDDIPEGADPVAFAEGQAAVAGQVARSLDTADGTATLIFCPTGYWGTEATPYLTRLGRLLPTEVQVFWTGPRIVSPTITATDARAVAAALRRKPTLWDNYPVNDAGMTLELHLGPLRGRSADLCGALDGLWFNVMEWAHSSLVPLATAARYVQDPGGYDADEAFRQALADLVQPRQLADAVAVLTGAANRSAISGPGPDAPPPRAAQDAAGLARWRESADVILESTHPLADELRPWAYRLKAAAAAGDNRTTDLAYEVSLFPQQLSGPAASQ